MPPNRIPIVINCWKELGLEMSCSKFQPSSCHIMDAIGVFLFLLIFGKTVHRKKKLSLHMHAKPSFAHRLQTAKMASSRTRAQNNGPRAQKNGP